MIDQTRLLSGKKILITRPEQQSHTLIKMVEDYGGCCRLLPLFTIKFRQDVAILQQQLQTALQTPAVVIFLSANAVMGVAPLWSINIINSMTCIAIGSATASALKNAGIVDVLIPEIQNSEGILALPCLQEVSGRRIILVSGENSRALLAEVLQQRQAQVISITSYRRQALHYSSTVLDEIFSDIDSVICTSGEGLQQLLSQLSPGGLTKFKGCRLIVISERIAEYARQYHLRPVIATGASDAAIVHALITLS